MSIFIEKIRPVLKRITKILERRAEFLRERLDGFLGRRIVYEELVYTEQEETAIEETAEITQDFFPEAPGEYLLNEDFESRCEAIEDYGSRLIAHYGLDGVEIVVTDEAERFPEKNAVFIYGYASMSDRKIYINAHHLQINDSVALEHIVSTVIHELRHMIQYDTAAMRNTYGVPYERRRLWRYNMTHYIEVEYDMEGYLMQPLEFDARNFTNRVWRQAYHKRVSEQ